jgi:hypothetical protein
MTFLLSIMEIDDNHGFAAAQQYAITRLKQLKDANDLQANQAGTGTADIAAAKAFTGQFLRTIDQHLLASLIVTRASGPNGGKREHPDPPGGHDAGRPSGTARIAKPETAQICFDHRPHDAHPCARPNCQRKHLDTSKADQLARFDSALKTFEANKANQATKRRRQDP